MTLLVSAFLFAAHADCVGIAARSGKFTSDGKFLVLRADKIHVLDAKTLKGASFALKVYAIASGMSANANYYAVASQEGIHVLDLMDGGKEIARFAVNDGPRALIPSDDGKKVLVGYHDRFGKGPMAVYEAATGKEIERREPGFVPRRLRFFGEGKTYASDGYTAFDTELSPYADISFNREDGVLILDDKEGMRVMDMKTEKTLAEAARPRNRSFARGATAVSDDNRLVALNIRTIERDVPPVLEVWDLKAKKILIEKKGTEVYDISFVDFSPKKGERLAVGWGKEVCVYDIP